MKRWLLLAALLCVTSSGLSAGELGYVILDDIAKPTKDQVDVKPSDTVFDGKQVVLKSAGNETVAFQVLLQSQAEVKGVTVKLAAFDSPVQPHCELFYEHYFLVDRGAYSWGGGMGPLPWNKYYPDALIPLYDPYAAEETAVAQGFTLDPKNGPNQAVWIDVFVPKDCPAGKYASTLTVEAAGQKLEIPISLEVYGFALPDEYHVDGYGEMYSMVIRDENATNCKIAPFCVDVGGEYFAQHAEEVWPIYKRYIQMGHAHHFLTLKRAGGGAIPFAKDGLYAYRDKLKLKDKLIWVDFSLWGKYYGQVLDGTLFTKEEGYVGPGEKIPPSFFVAPFPEMWYGNGDIMKYLNENGGKFDEPLLNYYTGSAKNFWEYVKSRHWEKTRFFCYVFDECDGVNDKGHNAGDDADAKQNAMIHQAMKDTQDAIDRGVGEPGRINLIWTSHTRPGAWAGKPDDLANFIRWWIPNGGAYDMDYFQALRPTHPNDTFWFYHCGQPAIGNHSVNQTGIDMMTWGNLCWKYRVNGTFLWATTCYVNRNNPFDHPISKGGDDRCGNGVLIYPGSRLEFLGFKNILGPVSSFRIKSYRRGQQDYEYLWLLSQRKGSQADADALLDKVIQAGLAKADGLKAPAWSQNPADWYKMRADAAAAILAAAK